MRSAGYHLFETPIGTCAIAWLSDDGGQPRVSFFQLPEATPAQTEARIAKHSGGQRFVVPPGPIAEIVRRVREHLSGTKQDFRDVSYYLDEIPQFSREVYRISLDIPAGETLTYGALARKLGQPGAAQAVGQALGNNPIPLLIPCHRILAANGQPGGFSAHGGRDTKARLLEIEGAPRTLTLEF